MRVFVRHCSMLWILFGLAALWPCARAVAAQEGADKPKAAETEDASQESGKGEWDASLKGDDWETPQGTVQFGRQARDETPVLNRDPGAPLSEDEKIHHVLSRFCFASTPERIAKAKEMGIEKWFDQQLQGSLPEPRPLMSDLAKLDTLTMTNQQIVQEYDPVFPPELSLARRMTREQKARRGELLRKRYIPREQLKDAVLLRSIYGNNQMLEVLSDFWRYHFSIDVSKGTVRYYGTTYERDVIRANVFKNFRDLLYGQAKHPAMLVYLDNFISRAPTRGEVLKQVMAMAREKQTTDYAFVMEAINVARMTGLNENYARELMELHTLGVDNYYMEGDVHEVALALTGWGVTQDRNKPVGFKFRPEYHQSDNRRILRMKIPANPRNPVTEGEAILDMLCKHRGTSEFICYKLIRHLLYDRPPQAMVNRVAKVYQRKNGDLKEVYKAILKDEDFFNPRFYQAKFKRPFEFVVSACQVSNADVEFTEGLQRALLTLNEPIYQCEDPTGYYDMADVWRDPGVMAARWQFGLDLMLGQVRGVRIPKTFWDGLEPNNPLQWKDHLIKKVLPVGCSEQTANAVDGVIARYARFNPRPEQLGAYIVGLLLGSPEFQRQ